MAICTRVDPFLLFVCVRLSLQQLSIQGRVREEDRIDSRGAVNIGGGGVVDPARNREACSPNLHEYAALYEFYIQNCDRGGTC